MQAHGRRFRRLAEERLVPAGFRVVAPDLRGHGRSAWDPPWNLATHVEDVLALLGDEPHERVRLVGHSFGGRLALELLARMPERIAATALLDPALEVAPARALALADGEREERAYASADEARAWRRETAPDAPEGVLDEELREHLVKCRDGRFRFRYAQSAVVAMYGEVAAAPPVTAEPVPPLLVVAGARSGVFEGRHEHWLRESFGSVDVVTVPAGHMVLWEAFDATADAIVASFSR